MKFLTYWLIVLASVFGLVGPVPATGQQAPLGTRGAVRPAVAPEFSNAPIDPFKPIEPFKTYENASYGTGGIALRNRGEGVLYVSGVSEPVQAAYLYWAILFKGEPGRNLYQVDLRSITGRFHHHDDDRNQDPDRDNDRDAARLQGTLLGIGADPCWGSDGIAVFRAEVPIWLASGNGAYEVILAKGASGLTDGSDPWKKQAFPEADGASLVIVGTGASTVSLYDAGFTATTFARDLGYTLNLPRVSSGGFWDNIGADGQSGNGRSAVPLVSLKTISINGVRMAGPGGAATDNPRFPYNTEAGWNGYAGLPIPQLWDDSGYDISGAIAGSWTATITVDPGDDCVCTVANVLAQ